MLRSSQRPGSSVRSGLGRSVGVTVGVRSSIVASVGVEFADGQTDPDREDRDREDLDREDRDREDRDKTASRDEDRDNLKSEIPYKE